MVIKGIGTDFAKTERLFKLFSKYPDGFLQKALHQSEIAHFRQLKQPNLQQQYLASCWSVKEAMVKASGKRLLFPEIQCCKNQIGAPFVQFHGNAKKWMQDTLHVTNTHVSVTHDDGYTLAMVVLESTDSE